MSVRVTSDNQAAALYDSTTGVAFGPTFDTEAEAEAFLQFLRDIGERDPRVIPAYQLAELVREWVMERNDD